MENISTTQQFRMICGHKWSAEEIQNCKRNKGVLMATDSTQDSSSTR
jgi:hypothetical protein